MWRRRLLNRPEVPARHPSPALRSVDRSAGQCSQASPRRADRQNCPSYSRRFRVSVSPGPEPLMSLNGERSAKRPAQEPPQTSSSPPRRARRSATNNTTPMMTVMINMNAGKSSKRRMTPCFRARSGRYDFLSTSSVNFVMLTWAVNAKSLIRATVTPPARSRSSCSTGSRSLSKYTLE